jgi:hypothetical protein
MQLEGKCVAFGREANDGSILVEGGKSFDGAAFEWVLVKS